MRDREDVAAGVAQRGEPGAHRASHPEARSDVGRAPATPSGSLLVARLERWPAGDESRARLLGTIVIRERDMYGELVTPEGDIRYPGRIGMHDGRRPNPWEAVWRFLAGVWSVGVRNGWRYELGVAAGWWAPTRRADR